MSRLSNLEWLSLSENQLSGPIPSELGKLTHLEDLDLRDNDLSGQFRRTGQFNQPGLVVSPKQPVEWSYFIGTGQPHELWVLNLSENRLSGMIPSELATLTGLRWLVLSENQLSGMIPPELGNLANLFWLDLEDNHLIGTVPPQLGKLTNLNVWYLSGNRLNGCLPPGWQGVKANDFDDLGLVFCIAPSSSLTVAIDRDALVALYRDTDGDHWTYNDNWLSDAPLNTWYGVGTDKNGRVTYLDLRENGLRGKISPELGNLINLEWVDLAENQLHGTIPAEMGNLTNLQELYLDSNQLQGTIPAKLSNLTDLLEVSFLGNQLIGCAPAAWRNGVGSDLEILGLPYCAAPSSPLLGAADRDALIAFYRSANGGYWFNNRNWLSGAPLNTWHGVTTDDSGRVTKLELGHNGLSGKIPSELGTLGHLERLLLHGNALRGEIRRK